MQYNETHPTRKNPMNTNAPKPEIQTEDFGNGIIIKWNVYK